MLKFTDVKLIEYQFILYTVALNCSLYILLCIHNTNVITYITSKIEKKSLAIFYKGEFKKIGKLTSPLA